MADLHTPAAEFGEEAVTRGRSPEHGHKVTKEEVEREIEPAHEETPASDQQGREYRISARSAR